ncbi:amidohydrolase family protein [Ramlibacter albus]|uniref:Amidohydrolase family protein n=1 Tax=Ramlibacter albus TaxID=2079448 RepID=A0A923MCK0_9BURK|nr:amidohydrolase family protein [Ramlibacter albus]MBC5767883.1 amidohydrolase family protein [Ramlibacter albus]
MTVPATQFVDAHFHLWDLGKNYYPWLSDGDRPSVVKDFSSLRRNYLVQDFDADARTLAPAMERVAAVHIQAEHDPKDHVRETAWLQSVADDPASHGTPQAIVANADLAAPDAQKVLEAHFAFRNTRGIRQALHRRLHTSPRYDPLEDPAFQRNFGLVQRFGLSFDLQFFQEQGEGVAALVRAHPGVQFILTHCGMPLSTEAEYLALWRRNLQSLAALPNVAVKISGFGLWAPDWDVGTVRDFGGCCLDLFGVARCMLASNFPVDRIHATYDRVWLSYAEAFADLSPHEREALFAGNARRFYRIEHTKDAS